MFTRNVLEIVGKVMRSLKVWVMFCQTSSQFFSGKIYINELSKNFEKIEITGKLRANNFG